MVALHPEQRLIYHITDAENLNGILADGGLYSDKVMSEREPTVIGYDHIKKRRLQELTIPCAGNRLVGEFVPFYFCPRSPMLYTINIGNTGRPHGCQRTIVHLVSTVRFALGLDVAWAVADGNAGAMHTLFESSREAIANLDWEAIDAHYWSDKRHQKQAELLVADFFPWSGFHEVGCHNSEVAAEVQALIRMENHQPKVSVQTGWYY
jgi:hypothetical protein